MEIWRWLAENWFTLLQSVGIVGSLLFTAWIIRADSKARRIDNLLSITAAHRDIWQLYRRPELSRVLDPTADQTEKSITPDEHVFVLLIILHLSAVYRANKAGFLQTPEGMRRDVQSFFSLPIPKAIWQRVRPLQDRDFVRFVEQCLSA